MRFHYDKQEDALYIRFNESSYEKSKEVQDGVVFDYDKKNKLIGIEILDASQKLPKPLSLNLKPSAKISI